MYTDISDIQQANAAFAKTNHRPSWFGKDEMRFFGTIIDSTVVEGRFFFTCEKDPEGRRAWTVRECLPTGEIKTCGDFMGHRTFNAAKRFLNRKLTKGEGV